MRIIRSTATVSVPASSANLGPGFDAVGLALELRDEITLRTTTGSTRVTVEGEGAGRVPTDDNNLVVKALRLGLDVVGAPQTGIEMRCVNRIPHGRGLGSSSAAAVGGLAAAAALVEPGALPPEKIFQIATRLEGHPDNAAPAVYGGGQVGWIEPETYENGETRAYALAFKISPQIKITVLIPGFKLATSKARGLLPAEVPHRDAAFNVGRAALLPLALSQHPELLFYATEDRLHQEYRRLGMPDTLKLLDMLRAQRIPAAVSGAGPSIIVFASLAETLRQEVQRRGWKPRELAVSESGIIVADGGIGDGA